MNSTKYLQTDGRWGSLGYPKKPWYIRNCGCGEVSIANLLIEMAQYANYTPATIQPYCKQFAAPNGDGTYHSGIPAMMKHYGLTDVKECATMPKLWDELAKGDRVALYLMGSRNGGSNKVHWTGSGHYVCSVDYKVEGGKHWVYVKDSYSNSSLRNGWISYEGNMRNDVYKVWVGKKEGAPTPAPMPPVPGALVVDGIGGKATIKAMQTYFGTTVDGVISGQNKKLRTYYPSITSVEFVKKNYGSAVIKKLQAWCGVTTDGIIGKGTTAAWQKKLRDLGYLASNEKIDGYFGVKSMKAMQKFLNDHIVDGTPAPTPSTPAPAPTEPTPAPSTPTAPALSAFQEHTLSWWESIAASGIYAYVKYTSEKITHLCPICHKRDKKKGGNCIWWGFAGWRHGGGIKCRCACDAMTDQLWEKVLKAKTDATANKIVRDRLGIKDVVVIRNNGGKIPFSMLQPADIIAYFNGDDYKHTGGYIGDGKMTDCTNGRKPNIKYGVKCRTNMTIKVALRYTGE